MGLSKDRPSVDIHDARPLPGCHTFHLDASRESCTEPTRVGWPPFGSSLPELELVPPLPFLPASAAFSARRFAGLLHPAADHGVRQVAGTVVGGAPPSAWTGSHRPRAVRRRRVAFLAEHRHHLPKQTVGARLARRFARAFDRLRSFAWDAEGVPGTCAVPSGVLPFEVFPSSTAAPRHRGRCPLAVASSGVRSVHRCRCLVLLPRVARPRGLAPSPSPLLPAVVADVRSPILPWAYGSTGTGPPPCWGGSGAAGRVRRLCRQAKRLFSRRGACSRRSLGW